MKRFTTLLLFLVITFSVIKIPSYSSDHEINFTDEELAFIEAHPVIKLGIDPKFVPFEFIDDNGNYVGITADYLNLISERTGLSFDVVKGYTWPESYQMALRGEVDAVPAIGKTTEREELFLFSQPYYYFKRVIVTREEDTEISGMEDLDGCTVAVQQNSSHHSYLLSFPKINLSLYDSVEEALTAVATGEEKAFVGNLATTNYVIRTNGITNLRFVSFEAEKQQALYFACRKDWPELISIFNKAVDSISESDKQAINNKWIDLETDIDYRPIIRVITIVSGFIVAIFGVSFFWIIRLKKAKKEADEANEFKSSFLARMSHEIRTPLNAITGMAYLLKKTNLSLTQKMYADRITQASSNMLSIINDILDYSKIEAGKIEIENTSFSMDQVIQDVVNIISYKIEEQEIGFRLSKDPLVPNWFFGDSKRIEQILINILNNAVKFTSKGEVSFDLRLIAKENDKYHLAFTVKDTGIGMDSAQVKKLFLPFTQGDSSITRRFGGSGLGLSIVKNLLDLMGGEIQVFSTPGEGSTFVIHLSLSVDKEKESVYVKSLSGDNFKSVRTLVLEKTGSNMNIIESYLSSFGMNCELTTSQTSAISMLEAADGKFATPFDLFIIDYETPEEGGFKFVENILTNEKIVKKPKFIMILPMMREDLFDKLNEYHIDIGLGKPIIPSILFNGILDIFKLKAVSRLQPSESEIATPSLSDKNYQVLVAEDNKTNQLIVKSLLKQIGITAILAADGSEAVNLYNQYKDSITLILMDLHMPVMTGYEAAAEIRKISSDIPIIAMTADVILGVKEKCAKSGIFHYISKPFDPDIFIKTIKNLISDIEKNRSEEKEPQILDLTAGLKFIGGDETIYKQVLSEYYNENSTTLQLLSDAIDEKRYTDAAQIVHKVKSSSGSIGAKPLYELSIKLQKSLDNKDENDIPHLYKEFSVMFKKLLSEISLVVDSKKGEFI